MRKFQDVQIALKPINMLDYGNFLKKIKTESQTHCLAKFIIMDAVRLMKHPGEKDSFQQLAEYFRLQNKTETIPHFLLVNNPDFESLLFHKSGMMSEAISGLYNGLPKEMVENEEMLRKYFDMEFEKYRLSYNIKNGTKE